MHTRFRVILLFYITPTFLLVGNFVIRYTMDNTDDESIDYFEFNKEFTRYWKNIYNTRTTTTAGPDVMTNVLAQNFKKRNRKYVINNKSPIRGR